MQSQGPDFILPNSLREGLLRYLASRPLAEVIEGYTALQNLKTAYLAPIDPKPMNGSTDGLID